MGTRLKNIRFSTITKAILFAIMVLSLTVALHVLIESEGNFRTAFEENYFKSKDFAHDHAGMLQDLGLLINEYKSEAHIREGNTISDAFGSGEERVYFDEFVCCSGMYNYELSEEENDEIYLQVYLPNQIEQNKNQIINHDLRRFHQIQHSLAEAEGRMYYATDGTHVFANSSMTRKEQFQQYRAYIIYDGYQVEVAPKMVEQNARYSWFTSIARGMKSENHKIYMALDNDYLTKKIEEWQLRKAATERLFYWLIACVLGFALSFAALVAAAGRKSFDDRTIHMRTIDRWYVDLALIVLTLLVLAATVLVMLWEEGRAYSGWGDTLTQFMMDGTVLLFALLVFPLIFSIVRHAKNGTLFKHTLIYTLIRKSARAIGHLYQSGSVGVKTVLLVVGYPILVVVTFFMFPVTLGLAAWLALKKIKAFTAIRQGVERIRRGDLHYKITVDGKGELAVLADHINGIADGLKNSVDKALKSERLKTELITNVSHDIRTPLTSIITYVDLLKKEQDPAKAKAYIEVLDQKSQKLKMLTDDLFEAAKASSGNTPVNLEEIDVVSLLRQGMGELNNEVEEAELQFIWDVPEEKRLVWADGRLLWRSIENLLSNIFKYAMKGSRVYIDVEEDGNEMVITFKNISAQALNMPAEELLERFARGDASRTGDGSGLGLNIAKSLIELQHGKLDIAIDGDLFKAIIRLPKVGADQRG